MSQKLNYFELMSISKIKVRNLMFDCILDHFTIIYSKTCLKRPLKIDKANVLMTNDSLMKVKCIAECSKGAFCNTFDLH